MPCSYVLNETDAAAAASSSPNGSAYSYSGPVDMEHFFRLRHYVNDVITPIVFVFGIVGNIVTFVVLSNRRLYPDRRQTMLERSAVFGLRTLALSDFLFCAAGLPAPFLRSYASSTAAAATDGRWAMLGAYYLAHRGAFLNLFLFTSTWLIVLISVERYLVVCHPFRSPGMIHVRKTAVAYAAVFVVSLVVNLPLFVKFSIVRSLCSEGCVCYYSYPSHFFRTPVLVNAHKIVWSAVGTLVPLALILVSNAFLVRELLRCGGSPSSSARAEHRPSASNSSSEQVVTLRLTVTLTAIVVCFFLMVCPSMILQLIRFEEYHAVASPSPWPNGGDRTHSSVGFQVAIALTNLTQALKFASNFLLYCAINKTFRQTLTALMRCDGCRKDSGPVECEMEAML